MINVSSSFKENVKKEVREIRGMAELIVKGNYFNAEEDPLSRISISTESSATITNLPSVADNVSAMYKYASLEEDRFLLDGSFILPNKNYVNKNTGYIGEDADGLGSFEIKVNTISWMMYKSPETKNITIYFEEGYPTEFSVEIDAHYTPNQDITYTYNFTNNDKSVITTDGSIIPTLIDNDVNEFICISKVVINITNWNTNNRRARVKQVNIGETVLFENQDLIELKLDEETSIDNMDTPNNDCSILLNNYDRKFNLIDNNSVLNRLNKKSHIRALIGVSLEGGIEYVDMGSYQYNSYTDNQDKTITLNGTGALQYYEGVQNYLWSRDDTNKTVLETLQSMLLLDNEVSYNGILPLNKTDTENKREQLQAIAIYSGSYIKENRDITERLDNRASLKKQDNNSLDDISLSIQTKEPKIVKKNKTKTIVIKTRQVNDLVNEEKVLYEGNVSDRYSVKVDLNSTSPVDISSIKVYEKNRGGTETLLSSDSYIVYNSYYVPRVQIYSLTSDDIVGIKIVGKEYNYIDLEKEITNGDISEGEIIEYNNNYLDSDYQKQRVANYVFNREGIYEYEFEIEFNGDPSLEVGDVISFETVDGWMKGFIEKIEIEFNGGLLETIKGVCSNVL